MLNMSGTSDFMSRFAPLYFIYNPSASQYLVLCRR